MLNILSKAAGWFALIYTLKLHVISFSMIILVIFALILQYYDTNILCIFYRARDNHKIYTAHKQAAQHIHDTHTHTQFKGVRLFA